MLTLYFCWDTNPYPLSQKIKYVNVKAGWMAVDDVNEMNIQS